MSAETTTREFTIQPVSTLTDVVVGVTTSSEATVALPRSRSNWAVVALSQTHLGLDAKASVKVTVRPSGLIDRTRREITCAPELVRIHQSPTATATPDAGLRTPGPSNTIVTPVFPEVRPV